MTRLGIDDPYGQPAGDARAMCASYGCLARVTIALAGGSLARFFPLGKIRCSTTTEKWVQLPGHR
ncbi:MAG: hypothetical protein MI757_19340 [Pirellulales bacterium]|nr:hypothetical protein [Pirellulales bacterium]